MHLLMAITHADLLFHVSSYICLTHKHDLHSTFITTLSGCCYTQISLEKLFWTTIVATTVSVLIQAILHIMKENHAVENALATIGAVLWMIQNIPQVVKSYREKSTKGLSASLML